MKGVVISAAEAKRIQSILKLGTAIVDVDIEMKPKIRMHFSKSAKQFLEGDQPVDLPCGQASH
jgi:hypothetical protein